MHNGRLSKNWLITSDYQPITIRIGFGFLFLFLFLFFSNFIFLLKMISILGLIMYLDDNQVIHVVVPSVLFCFVLGEIFATQHKAKRRGGVKGANGIFLGKNGPPSSHIMRRKKCEATIFRQQVPKLCYPLTTW